MAHRVRAEEGRSGNVNNRTLEDHKGCGTRQKMGKRVGAEEGRSGNVKAKRDFSLRSKRRWRRGAKRGARYIVPLQKDAGLPDPDQRRRGKRQPPRPSQSGGKRGATMRSKGSPGG